MHRFYTCLNNLFSIVDGRRTTHAGHIGMAIAPYGGWSGGAMVLGKLPVPGRPTNLDYSRARAYCACSKCEWGCLDIFSLVYHFSFSLSLGDGPM